jgi:hypothetical protein
MAERAARQDAAPMPRRSPIADAACLAYVETSIPAGMTIATYRRTRARPTARRRLRHFLRRGVRDGR